MPIAGRVACEFLSSGSYILYIMKGASYLALTCEPWERRWNHLSLAGGPSFTAPLSRGVSPEEKNRRTYQSVFDLTSGLCSVAQAATCARDASPSLRRILETWFSIVRSERWSAEAI